jgi:hypothetical protein
MAYTCPGSPSGTHEKAVRKSEYHTKEHFYCWDFTSTPQLKALEEEGCVAGTDKPRDSKYKAVNGLLEQEGTATVIITQVEQCATSRAWQGPK